jgi:hypothetical protein
MKSVTLRAHFDGEQIRLDDPFPLHSGDPLSVVVWPREGEPDEEHADWSVLSAHCLEAAAGDDEPEYSLDLIKDPNSSFLSATS